MADVDYRDWIGSREEVEDVVTLSVCRQMAATLDDVDTEFDVGDPLPPMWHYCYFTPCAPMREVGPDGHPKRGGFLPPVALPRRMFANGTLEFHTPLRIGSTVRRVSEVVDVQEKHGKSGQLVFVTVRFDFYDNDRHCIEETQSYAYREMGAPNPAPEPLDDWPAVPPGAWMREITPDPVLLMRYSALTFNGHRIHYDRPYTTEVEEYPGLLVQGPLIATYMSELARLHDQPTLKSFRYRALAPIFDINPFRVVGNTESDGKLTLRALRVDGQIAQEAVATI